MKAAQISEYGDASVITINEIDKPNVGKRQILVEVHASSINPFDAKLRAGYMKERIPLQFPATLGGDIAGIVSERGDDVTTVVVGDQVYGQAAIVAGGSGAFAEYAATKASQIAKAPKNVDFKQAASLTLVGPSAWQAMIQHIKLQPDQKIFIHGGAGGIGIIAIQIAKHLGAHVATTASGGGIETVTKLGADEVIDYKKHNFIESLNDYDAVFDTVGGDDFTKALSILKPGGIAVSTAGQADQAKANELGVTAIAQSTKVTTEALNELRLLVEEGIVTPQVSKVFPLAAVSEAFRAWESGNVQGKVVIEVR
ncbi:MAG TPA: NADP-dependent oxidoreductase [Candidatus Saccharimonadia bacterium]